MPKSVCWIDDVNYSDANQELRETYDQVLSPTGQLDNLYRGFSLSPQTILPADQLYKAAMHHSNNVLCARFAELLGTYVAILSGCDYARAHHAQNFISLSDDPVEAQRILEVLSSDTAFVDDRIDTCGSAQETAALKYVHKLCMYPAKIQKTDVDALRSVNWRDTEISEIVQVAAMFSYFVRVINGVGISLGDEKLGLY